MSSHGSDGPLLVPQGTSGVLGAGILAAAFSSGGALSNAAERLKTDLAPTLVSTLVLQKLSKFVCTDWPVAIVYESTDSKSDVRCNRHAFSTEN